MGKRWNLAILLVALISVGVGAFLGHRSRPDESGYSQETPEATIATARLMLERGQASQLDRLIYAENEDMRRALRRMGAMFGSLQALAGAIQTTFPEDVAKLKADLEAAAKQGKSTNLIQQLGQNMAPQRVARRRNQPPDGTEREALDKAILSVLADPYGWLTESGSRLSTAYLTDDSVSLRWDEKTILPPVGIQMKKGPDDLWYFALPTGLPVLSQYMPRTSQEYQIWGNLFQVFDNALIDLRKQIETGRVRSLNETARKAGENAFVPAAMVFFAYSKAIEERKKAGG